MTDAAGLFTLPRGFTFLATRLPQLNNIAMLLLRIRLALQRARSLLLCDI